MRRDQDGLLLHNENVSRYLSFTDGAVRTISLRLAGAGENYVAGETPEPAAALEIDPALAAAPAHRGRRPEEFAFLLDGRPVTGRAGWDVVDVTRLSLGTGEGASLSLAGHGLALEIDLLLYPDSPVIRKRLRIENRGVTAVRIENLAVESLALAWGNTHNLVYHNYARYKHIGPFVGAWDDPLVAVQEQGNGRGLLLGNEAPGVLKRVTACLDGHSITIGLTHADQLHPFRVNIAPGEQWESPWTFLMPYRGVDPSEAIAGPLAAFVRRDMGIRLTALQRKPTFVYNTWNPFRTEINEALIRELADAAAECGIREFVLDDGWQTNRGDWEIDREKFPNGLKPVFDYIRSKGMKPGLWLAPATVSEDSRVFREHPDWVIRGPDGQPTSVHAIVPDKHTMCMTTGWKEYIKEVLLRLVNEHGLEYVKLDLAVVAGAYMFESGRSGCYAGGHVHADRPESMLQIYRRTWELFDELHTAAPELFIDCTFETMGALQMVDYAMCKHAEGNWLSNFEDPSPAGSLRVRHMGWWRGGVIPATALVIGNQPLDGPNWERAYQSLLGTLPILLGDLRAVSEADRAKMRAWSEWLDRMAAAYDVMMYRQDLPGFGEPAEGRWDGWSRINIDTRAGGIVGIFRQGGIETDRAVRIAGLDPERRYVVRDAPSGTEVREATGRELLEDGIPVTLTDPYGARVFSVEGI